MKHVRNPGRMSHIVCAASCTSGTLAPALSTALQCFVPSPAKRSGKNFIYKLEAGGILIIGALILLLTVARYWHHIAWGTR
jgi:hypothetical protein